MALLQQALLVIASLYFNKRGRESQVSMPLLKQVSLVIAQKSIRREADVQAPRAG